MAATDVKNDPTLSTSLVSYWELEEASGTRADSHGSNTLADNNTVGQTTGKIGNAADFELDTSEYLNITDGSQTGLDITSDISFSLWVQPESALSTDSERALIYKWASGDASYGLTIVDVGGVEKIRLRIYDAAAPGSGVIYDWDISLGTGTFKHVVVYWDQTGHGSGSGTAECWVDGSSQGTVTDSAAADINNSAAAFSLSSLSTGIQWYFDGALDEVGIWSKVISSGEVSDLYNSGDGIPYEAVAAGPATVKTMNGVSLAAIKTIDTAAIVTIKSIDTVE